MSAPTTTSTLTGVSLRPGEPRDAEACGRIFWEAFASIASQHSFPIEPGVPEFTNWKATQMLSDPGFVATVAESKGEIIGSVFVDVRAPILGVGPVTVDPAFQDGGVGRCLMEHVLSDAKARGSAGVRLVQTAYHYRSLSLYAKLGFQVREPLSVMQGEIQDDSPLASEVRPASPSDIDACNELCILVHGHERNGELRDAISEGSAVVAERGGRSTGYATGVGYGWHAVGETNEDLISILRSAKNIIGLGVLVPSRNHGLLGWCLDHGLRLVQQSTLMTTGLYNEPQGSYLPSIVF